LLHPTYSGVEGESSRGTRLGEHALEAHQHTSFSHLKLRFKA